MFSFCISKIPFSDLATSSYIVFFTESLYHRNMENAKNARVRHLQSAIVRINASSFAQPKSGLKRLNCPGFVLFGHCLFAVQ